MKADHEKLWDIADKCLKDAMPEGAYQALAPRVKGFRAGYGSVLWFEDQDALDTLKEKNPAIQVAISDCKCLASSSSARWANQLS